MFEYEWGNPEDNYSDASNTLRHPAEDPYSASHIDLPTFHSVFDHRAFASASYPLAPPSFLSSSDFFTLPKPEPPGPVLTNSGSANLDRIGLNLGLGGRTYFSAADEGFLSRLYRRPNSLAPANSPKCLAEGCDADLSAAKHYHRRHKVCEFHSKASTVVAAGLTQRFCQQCSRFHLLTEFDNGKRSCRRRLEDHNRRRRKSHRTTTTTASQDRRIDNPGNSPSCSENPPRSPSESRAQSVSMEASPSVSSSSMFY